MRPFIQAFDLSMSMNPDPREYIYVCDAVGTPAWTSKPVTTLRQTDLEHTIETLRLIDVT